MVQRKMLGSVVVVGGGVGGMRAAVDLDALSAGTPAQEILNQGLIAGMDIVGERMESGDMFIPEVLMAAQAMAGNEPGMSSATCCQRSFPVSVSKQ